MQCGNPECRYFMQEVPNDHRHWIRCGNPQCSSFQQYVSPDHRHSYKAEGNNASSDAENCDD